MDEVTLRRARNGDPQAFEALATPCEGLVWSVCWKMLQQREDAQDAAQETMLKAYQSISSWRGDAAFSTWIYHIAVTTCMDALRKRRVRASASLDSLRDEGFDPPSREIPPAEALEKKDEREHLRRALDSLDPDQRTALTLYAMEGKDYESISNLMNTSTGTVKSRIHRARKKILSELESFREQSASPRVNHSRKEDADE